MKPGAASKLSRVDVLLVALFVGLFVFFTGALCLDRYWSFQQPLGLDNAYFFQRVWQASFLEEPARTLLNTETGHGLVSGRHFEPILLLGVPFVGQWPRMETLLLFQVVLLSLGGVAAYVLSREITGDRLTACCLMGAWLCQPGLWNMAVTDFRTMSLAAPFVAICWWALFSGRWRIGLLSGALAMGCREEVLWLMAPSLVFWVLHGRYSGKRLAVWSFSALVVVYAGVIFVFHGEASNFFDLGELPGAALSAVNDVNWSAPIDESTSGGALAQLQAALGSGFWLLVVAPLASVPVAVTWLGKASNPEVAGPWAYHLWAVALGTMALVLPKAMARLGAWVGEVRGPGWSVRSIRAFSGALFVLQLQAISAQQNLSVSQALETWAGDTRPSTRVSTAWSVIRRVPVGEAVLTESLYVAQLADRRWIYSVDDFHARESQDQVLSAIEWVLVRKTHEWTEAIEAAGFSPYADGGRARLYKRDGAPGARLNPIMPY